MHDNAKPDLKESFIWEQENFSLPASQDSRETSVQPANRSLYGLNQWPEFTPDLRTMANQYYQRAHSKVA